MKLRDLMGATLRFLQSDCAKFRMLWDWSPCVSLLLTSDVMVRGYVSQTSSDAIRIGTYRETLRYFIDSQVDFF